MRGPHKPCASAPPVSMPGPGRMGSGRWGLGRCGRSRWRWRIGRRAPGPRRSALSKQSPEVVAELPQALALAARAYALAPDHAQGDLAGLMGNLEAARPGGQPAQARRYFERAQALSQGRSPAIWVAQAEALALAAGDRAAFEADLRRAVAASEGQRTLVSTLMRERALWLLERLDDLF